jgi:hypothetical protein
MLISFPFYNLSQFSLLHCSLTSVLSFAATYAQFYSLVQPDLGSLLSCILGFFSTLLQPELSSLLCYIVS